MFQIGLSNLTGDNLLLRKVNIFACLNKILFGSGSQSILGLSSLASIVARPCAADDLDIFNTYASEPIEFLDLKSSTENHLNSNLVSYSSIDNGISPAHQHYEYTPNQHQHPHGLNQRFNTINIHNNAAHHNQNRQAHNINFNANPVAHLEAIPIPMQAHPQAQPQPHAHSQSFYDNQYVEQFQSSASHFNLNMNHSNFINDQYFQDFKSLDARDLDYQSVYGSSSESYVSPLDDEFLKKFTPEASNTLEMEPSCPVNMNATASNKKRRFEATAQSVVPTANQPILGTLSILAPGEVDFYDVNTIFNEYLMNNSKPVQQHQLPCNRAKQDEYQKSHTSILRNHSLSSTSSNISTKKYSISKKIKIENDPNSSMISIEKSIDKNNSEAKYKCTFCDAKFKVKGYLTRHLKKHNSSKAFICPFYQESPSKQCNPSKKNVVAGTKCHPTGGFSRRDTFKTHLKALHFIYPPGTKSSERNSIGGNCAGCFAFFDNNLMWLEDHIEKGLCSKIVKSPESQSY